MSESLKKIALDDMCIYADAEYNFNCLKDKVRWFILKTLLTEM
jgi:hypothetical protein